MTTAAPKPAPHQRALIGKSSDDMLVNPVEGLDARGERILDEGADNNWGLVAGNDTKGAELIVLDERRPAKDGKYYIVAVLALPTGTTWREVAWSECTVDGKKNGRVVATVAPYKDCEPRTAPATRAWRVDPIARHFVPMATEGVTCLKPACEEQSSGVTGGIPGGVPGGAIEIRKK